jgi:hypothetical protein
MSKLASVGRLLLLALALAFTFMTFAPGGGAAAAGAAGDISIVVSRCHDDCGCRNGSESCCVLQSGAVCLDYGVVETR